jgi:hydrogenase nickel incorporation protein HypA/HybF
MHEMSLTEKIYRLVLTEAKAHGAKRVTKITISIGELSGVAADSVEFYFRMLAKGTMAQDAILEFNRVPARLFCIYCKQEFNKLARDFFCPNCGNLGRLTEIGQECTIESIEVD